VVTFLQGLLLIVFLAFSNYDHNFHTFQPCSMGMPVMNGSVPAQQAVSLPIGAPVLPAQVMPTPVVEPVGSPSECLLLKNMFDPTTEVCG